MKKVIERIVESPGAPNENDLWLNGTTLRKFQNGQWVAISGGGSDSSDSDSGDGSFEQVQSDWAQSDDTQVDYIKNKPTIPGVLFVQGDLTGENESFAPSSGQPSYGEAKAAFKSGESVILVNNISDVTKCYYRVIGLLEGSDDNPDTMWCYEFGNTIYWDDPNWVEPGTEG